MPKSVLVSVVRVPLLLSQRVARSVYISVTIMKSSHLYQTCFQIGLVFPIFIRGLALSAVVCKVSQS